MRTTTEVRSLSALAVWGPDGDRAEGAIEAHVVAQLAAMADPGFPEDLVARLRAWYQGEGVISSSRPHSNEGCGIN